MNGPRAIRNARRGPSGSGRQIHRDIHGGFASPHMLAKRPEASPRKASLRVRRATVPETDTGRQGAYPKALVRTLVKELGKISP